MYVIIYMYYWLFTILCKLCMLVTQCSCANCLIFMSSIAWCWFILVVDMRLWICLTQYNILDWLSCSQPRDLYWRFPHPYMYNIHFYVTIFRCAETFTVSFMISRSCSKLAVMFRTQIISLWEISWTEDFIV